MTSPPYYALRSYLDASHADKHREIGSEPTPEAYLATMVQVFREVRRVLRPDGTCWVNIGDSYAGNPNNPNRNGLGNSGIGSGPEGACKQREIAGDVRQSAPPGVAAKQLLMMPARLALALQAEGWWIRSDIIWHKPNPMPESVTDRPTSAHEHVFLLTRSSRYYYDADAVREDADPRASRSSAPGAKDYHDGKTDAFNQYRPSNRNLRNVWTLATHPYIHAHFATYPPALAERCIRAGTSERGCCAQCGKAWVRVTDISYTDAHRGMVGNQRKAITTKPHTTHMHAGREDDARMDKHVTTTGWQPGCSHDADIVPCVVLDPFIGAGTTALVSDRLQRDCIGIDLNTAYTQMAMDRCRADSPLFHDAPMPEHPEDRQMADLFASLAAD